MGLPAADPWWWGFNQQPPEIVAEAEVEIGADGTVPVEIDTAVAKEIHPDQDHSYSITAEVVDASRRTIVGAGSVTVARKPFKVFSWVDRGYYTSATRSKRHSTPIRWTASRSRDRQAAAAERRLRQEDQRANRDGGRYLGPGYERVRPRHTEDRGQHAGAISAELQADRRQGAHDRRGYMFTVRGKAFAAPASASTTWN